MRGTISKLGELHRRDDGFLPVVLMPQLGNDDGARVAAYAETRIIAYVQTRGQIGAAAMRQGQLAGGAMGRAGASDGIQAGQARTRDDEAVPVHAPGYGGATARIRL
jgi:hypothetical protein